MKLQELAKAPELIEIVLDDEDIIKTYGEPITFYTYDTVNLTTYFEFFEARTKSQFDILNKIIKKMILNEEGKPAIQDNQDLPVDISAAVLNKIGEILGKSQSRPSMKKTGTPQK